MSNSKGIVIDAPNALVMSKDNIMNICTAKSGEIKINGETLDINGGWSFYELAKINTKKKIEISLKNAFWQMNSMAMQTGGTVTKGKAVRYYFDKLFTVSSNKITIPFLVKSGTLKLEGFAESTAEPTTKQFKTTASTDSTEVTFFAGDFVDGTEINPVFGVEVDNSEILSVKANDTPKGGTTILQYPVYGEKKDDQTSQDIIGYLQWTVFKTVIQSDVGMGGSYKSASEFDVKITGLDPKRPDEKIFDLVFFEKTA